MCDVCKAFKIGATEDVAADMMMTAAMAMVKTIIDESTHMPDVIVEALVKSSESGMARMISEIEKDMETDEAEKAAMIAYLRSSHSTFTRFAKFVTDLKADMRLMHTPENEVAVKNLTMLLTKKLGAQRTA